MLRVSLLVFSALIAASLCSFSSANEVVVLTENNIDDLIANGPWLLEFYAPWCGHCKHLEPIFNEVAEIAGDKINLGKVDCTEFPALQKRFNVTGFPTIYFYRDGEARAYRDDRTKEAFLRYVDAVTGPAVSTVTLSSLPAALRRYPVTFLFVGPHGEEERVFEQVARKLQGVVGFASTVQPEVAKKYGVSTTPSLSPTVVAITEGSDDEQFKGPFEVENLRAFVEENQFPLLSELTASNFAELTKGLLVFCVTDPSKATTSKQYQDACREVAKGFRGQFLFAHADGLKYDKYMSQFGLSPSNYPIAFVLDYANEQFYHLPSDRALRTKGDLTDFLNGITDGSIKPNSVGVWWSPARLWRWFEKWLGQFTDTQLMLGSLVATVLLSIVIFFLCCMGPEEPVPQQKKDRSLQPVAAAGNTSGGASSAQVGEQTRRRKKAEEAKIVEDDS